MRGREYIVRSRKTQFLHKKNRENRFTKWMNQFRYQETNPVEQEKWIDSEGDWVVSSEPRKEWIYSYIFMNRFSVCQRLLWDDSYINRFKYMWIDSHKVRDFIESIQTIMSRFKLIQNDFWHFFQRTHNNKTKPHIPQGALTW